MNAELYGDNIRMSKLKIKGGLEPETDLCTPFIRKQKARGEKSEDFCKKQKIFFIKAEDFFEKAIVLPTPQ